MSNTALAVVQNRDTAVYQEKVAWELMRDQASILIKTGFLPDAIKTPEQAMAVMMKGRELGVPHMYALSNIAIVKGKPTCSAELMLALIRRDYGQQAIRVKSTDNASCTVEWRQTGWTGTQHYTFTIQDAQTAGLTKNPTWTAYPAAMLRARCISAVARMAFPECIAGMYSPGELGEAVIVTDEGDVISGDTPPDALSRHVDTDTGEVTDEPPPPPVAPQRPAQDARAAPAQQQAIAALHAMGKDLGLTHDDLHAICVSRGVASMTDLSTQQALQFRTWLKQATTTQLRDALRKAGRDVPDEPPAPSSERLPEDLELIAQQTDAQMAARGSAGNDRYTR